jgi:5'-3' exonuclease
MGIPAYFSFIVRNYPNILSKFKSDIKIDNFYLDCNSLIYDAVHDKDFENLKDSDINIIINKVISKLYLLVNTINPTENLFIAFDGVAPLAKLDQQRNRRYKSIYQNNISKNIFKKKDAWNTSAITPGTEFMEKLNKVIKKKINSKSFSVKKLILSLSDEIGEGEHKIFQFIRDFPESHNNKKTVVYGLDADLIMLCINHLPISNEIYLYRETPEFIKSISSELEPNESYLLNIPELSESIISEMKGINNISGEQRINCVYDYIFLCFFLGNDFLPHFPALNIRTGAINKLLNAYKECIIDGNLTNGTKIYWKNVRKLISFLAEQEEDFIRKEMKLRSKKDNQYIKCNTQQDKWKKFDNTPQYNREVEKFININNQNWQYRYYDCLFDMKIDDMRKKQICINYLEGLEWTMKYYTIGCVDWRWSYHYYYPPLLEDLIKFIPYFDTTFVTYKKPKPVNALVQLAYVLPRESLFLLPNPIFNFLIKYKSDWYESDCEFIWAFCKYFWESHVCLPEINIDELELIIEKLLNKG